MDAEYVKCGFCKEIVPTKKAYDVELYDHNGDNKYTKAGCSKCVKTGVMVKLP